MTQIGVRIKRNRSKENNHRLAVIGDENPLREAEHWRVRAAQYLKVPFWTVDADVVVPSRLLGKEH